MRIALLTLLTASLVACYSSYAPVSGAPTADITLLGHKQGGMEMFTYKESCGSISPDSHPMRLAGTGVLNPTQSFTIQAGRPMLIGVSFTSGIYQDGACTVAYESTFDAGVSYQIQGEMRLVERVNDREALFSCTLNITPSPRQHKKHKAEGGLIPRPVC